MTLLIKNKEYFMFYSSWHMEGVFIPPVPLITDDSVARLYVEG